MLIICIISGRNVPIPLINKVQEELDGMLHSGVITKITEPTTVCPYGTNPKKMSVRTCVAPKTLRKAVLREHYTWMSQHLNYVVLQYFPPWMLKAVSIRFP